MTSFFNFKSGNYLSNKGKKYMISCIQYHSVLYGHVAQMNLIVWSEKKEIHVHVVR